MPDVKSWMWLEADFANAMVARVREWRCGRCLAGTNQIVGERVVVSEMGGFASVSRGYWDGEGGVGMCCLEGARRHWCDSLGRKVSAAEGTAMLM